MHFGLGSADRLEAVRISWPSGAEQTIDSSVLAAQPLVNREVRIVEGALPVLERLVRPNRWNGSDSD